MCTFVLSDHINLFLRFFSRIAGSWYGLTREPVDMGSGGGGSEGGAGGAYLYLKVYETLTLEGHIKVDGQAGQGMMITSA